MPSTAEALKLIPPSDNSDSRLTIVPENKTSFIFGSVVDRGANRIRSGLRDRSTEIAGKPLKDYSDIELRAAIKRAQRNFLKDLVTFFPMSQS